jgi:hypothetical protein
VARPRGPEPRDPLRVVIRERSPSRSCSGASPRPVRHLLILLKYNHITNKNVSNKPFNFFLTRLSTRRANTSLTTGGRIAVFGDSSCLDSANQRTPCHWLLAKMLQYTSRGLVDENVFGVGNAVEHLDNADFVSDRLVLPSRLPPNENDLRKFSRVLIDGMGADGAGENTVYRSMLCEQPERPQFQSFEQTDDQVSLVWEVRAVRLDLSLTSNRFPLSYLSHQILPPLFNRD